MIHTYHCLAGNSMLSDLIKALEPPKGINENVDTMSLQESD